MNIIVLSGPICAGKSTVARFFKDIGYTVINSDSLAKKIIKDDDVLQRKVSILFNDNNIFKGKVKWTKLREYVFLNKKNTIRYNKLVHPPFFRELNRILSNNKKNQNSKLLKELSNSTSSLNAALEAIASQNKMLVREIKDQKENITFP